MAAESFIVVPDQLFPLVKSIAGDVSVEALDNEKETYRRQDGNMVLIAKIGIIERVRELIEKESEAKPFEFGLRSTKGGNAHANLKSALINLGIKRTFSCELSFDHGDVVRIRVNNLEKRMLIEELTRDCHLDENISDPQTNVLEVA